MPHLTIEVSLEVLRDLQALHATGLYGGSVRIVAEELLRLQLRRELLVRRAAHERLKARR